MTDEHDDLRYTRIPNAIVDQFLDKKYKLEYSQRLSKKVYVLKEFVDKPVFERHKRYFGHTDIGWTVKYPKQLIRVLLREGVWKIDEIDAE